jgi:hypothetical protein
MKGKIWIADDFDAPMTEEELREWYDRPTSLRLRTAPH